jgi:hypothetical protein
MRFRFPDADERKLRERVLASADAFLAQVRGRADELARARAPACREFFREGFSAIDARLDADVIDAPGAERTVALLARGDRGVAPLLDALESRLPVLPGLRLVCGTPALPTERAIARVAEELSVDLADARARAGFARGHLLELVIYASAFASSADERALDAAELLVANVLGDRVFEDWIGEVRVAPLPRKSALRVLDNDPIEEKSFPLAALAETVGAAVEGLIAGLPEGAFWRRERDSEQSWTMFELEPELAHDYAGQDDLAIATTLAPEMLKCFLRGQPFSSLRFSRHGERFVYLKLDGEGRSSEHRLASRRELEDRLSDALSRAGLGSVVGNGIGVRYAYVDLALTNLDGAIERVRAVAREARVAERSWLLFCDADLAYEWLGIWDETPAPPFAG